MESTVEALSLFVAAFKSVVLEIDGITNAEK